MARALSLSLIVLCLSLSSFGLHSERQTLKIEPRKPVSLTLKMSPAGGNLILRAGSERGELEVILSQESQASLDQSANEITIRGQKKASTYTVLIPRTGIDLNLDINGKTWHIRQAASGSAYYEFEIK